MGASAEGKISLSVELSNFKDIAGSLKKGLSAELKQVPLDINFNNKELEQKTAQAIKDINTMLSKSRIKNLDFSSILPNFVNEINKQGISEEIRAEVAEGFRAGLSNLNEIVSKKNYDVFKRFDGEDLKRYFADLNNVEDMINAMEGLSKRQRSALLKTVAPSFSDLDKRGGKEAEKKYTKGAKKLSGIWQLRNEYSDVLQYATSESSTEEVIKELSEKARSGGVLSKNDVKDLLGYITRYKHVTGKNTYDDLFETYKDQLKEDVRNQLIERTQLYFQALDKIYNSTAKEINYSDLLTGVENTTNKKLEGVYNSEAESIEKVKIGKAIKDRIKLKSEEKPELRKREKKEDTSDTTRRKSSFKKDSEEFDEDEKKAQDYDEEINKITEELKKIRDKIDEAREKQQQLRKEIEGQQKISEEKTRAYLNYKENYRKYSSSAKKAKQDSDAFKETIEGLNKQIEKEKQNKEQIEKKYNELITKKELIKKEIEEKEKQLNAILPNAEKQEADIENKINGLNDKKAEKETTVKDKKEEIKTQDDWLKWYDAILKKEYEFKGSKAKSEAYEALKNFGKKYLEFRKDPNSSLATNKQEEAARFAVKHYKLWQAAKEAGVAESRLESEKFDSDDDFAYNQAVDYLQQQRNNTEKRREQIKNELEETKAEIIGIETEIKQAEAELKSVQEQKKKLLNELRVNPAEKENNNESNIKRKKIELDSSNSKIQKLEDEKAKTENRLQEVEKYLEKNELTPEREEKYENRLKQLEEESNTQGEILQQKKEDLEREIEKTNELVNLGKELGAKQDLLIQKQKEAKERQEELNRQEEERKKKEEEADEQKSRTDKTDSESKQEDGKTKGSETVNGTDTSIPSEKLQEILTLLGNIQKALGTLEDGSDVPSIIQSIKDMAEALKELNTALTEIKAKDFNLNIGLPNNNPIGQQGEAKRKILKELEQQYNELDSYFTNKYGNDSIAFNALSKLEGGSDYVKTMMSDFSIIGDTNAPLADKINVYKTLIEQLRSFVIQEGGDLNKVISNTLAPDKIIEQINQDILNANPTTAISKLFENMQVSINASLAKINSESQGFNFLTGSAEEAAEAKRKFVEANKEVLQSIIGSIPKIEQEAEALEKVEEVKSKADDINNNLNKNENNKEDIKQQQELLKQEQLQIRAEQEREKIQQKFEEIQLKRNARLNEQRKQRAQDIKDRIGNRLNQPSAQQIAEAQLKEQQKIQQKIQEQLREDIYDDYSKSQEPQYNYESDYDDLIRQAQRQAQEIRQIYEEEISKEFEIQIETKLNLVEDSTGQLSLFDDILPEKNWGQTTEQEINSISQAAIEGQISFQDLENAINNSEKTFAKLMSPKTTVGKSFIQNKDLPNEFLKQYEDISTKNGEGYKATSNLRELKNLGDELANIKTKLKVSFDEAGNLKSFADPLEIQSLLERYDELTQKIQRLKLLIESPNSQEFKLLRDTKEAEVKVEKLTSALEKAYAKLSSSEKITTDIEKLLNPFAEANIPMTESIEQMIDSIGRMRDIHSELAFSFDSEGKLIGDPKRVQSLITEYNNLSNIVDELKTKISSPASEENIALKMAKDAKKAQKELENLKSTVDKTLGKTNLFEVRTQKTIDAYGAYEGNGEGKKAEFITPEVVGEKYGENFKQQQIQVQELIKQLGLYKTAVEELRTLRLSDETTVEQLTQANDKVKTLEQNITTLSQTIKTSGVANATETQIESLRTKFETLLKNAPNLTKDVREQIQEYIQTLSSGATVSKNAYSSMTADLRRFLAEQTRGSTIWEQMVGKMREGVAFLATKFSFYQIFNQFRQGFEVVHQFDDALTEMMKVSDETRLSLERYQKTTFDTADAIGTNALQIQNSTADFMRLGETLDEAAKSAKAANILMNVSEFQSIDEATKSLIAMGAAYDDLSKMNIIDKLNEVGNNFAISTSEAATALQASASALTTANNDMDEALALITAGNAVVQDATKVGTGIRTIALRLTGTKSAKEELEEMGEETENVITTQSKLRDVIKEATAVASNEYKGFDILDDNGNYKSTYEIMLGIAEVYDEILETDKKFGRNNANLLLENVAGKVRANIAASIFQNPELLKEAYASSQSADNSAMRENEKYMQSISGHLAQLKNAWQEMWANAANRDVINFFIDAAKAVVNFVNAIGLIPTTFALSLPFLEMFSKARSGKGLVTSFLEWANGLNEIKKLTEELGEAEVASDTASTVSSAMKTVANKAEALSTQELEEAYLTLGGVEEAESLADVAGTITSDARTVSNKAETLSVEEQAEAYIHLGEAEAAESVIKTGKQIAETGKEATGTAGKLSLLKGAFKGLKTAIGLPTLAFAGFIAACLLAKKVYDAYNEARFNEAKQATDSIKQQQDSMSAQIESYKELKAQLDSGDLSEQETIETKQKILDIQKQISNEYGSAAKGVDLVNGKLEKQVGILNSITEKDAGKQYALNRKGFDVAINQYRKIRPYTIDLKQSSNEELNNQIKDSLSKAGLQPYGEFGDKSLIFKNATDTVEMLEKARDSLEELKKEYKDPKDVEAVENQIEEIEKQIGKAYETIDKYEETAFKGMELQLARNKRTGYDAFQNYQTSTSDLESAYASGNTKKIEEARKAFEEAKKAKDNFLDIDGNAQFTSLFDTIDTSFVEAKNQYHDVVESFKDIPEPKDMPTLFEEDGRKILKRNTDALGKEKGALDKAHKAAEKLYKLNPDRVDIEGTLLDNTYASGKFADALNELMNELNWSADNTDNLISALIDAGIIQGNVADIADYASASYNNFASSVDEAIISIGALNTALAESASGKGITDPNLEAFRKAFGEDGLKILEKTANGYHLNTEGAYLLRNAQDALIKANYASALNEQYTALDKLQEGYQKALLAGEDTTGFVQQRQAIQDNIDKLNEELMAYQNANSAYQTWLANQNSEGEREMYNSVYSGYDAVKDELDRGFAGAKTRSWLDLIFNDEGEEDFDVWTASAEELRNRFKEVKKDIEGTGGYSIADFFTVDKNGKSTSEGIWNFFEAIENKQDEVGQKFVDLEEEWFDFSENGDYQIADLLGMDVESVQAILRAAADAGFEIHLDQPLFSMEQLEEKANSAKESLEEITGKKLNIDLDPSSVEEADESMKLLSEYQQSIAESEAIEPNVKTEMLESVASLMEYIVAQKKELLENNLLVFRVDNTEIDKSKDEITDVYNKLQTYTKEKGNIDLSEAFTIDPMRINDIEYLTELQKEIFGATQTLDVDSTQAEYLKQLLVEIKEHIDLLNESNVGLDGKITVNELMAAEQVVNDINAKLDYASQRNIQLDWSVDEEFVKELDTLANLPEEAKIALNIPTDATGEQLLELAQQGELHIGVTVDGNVPQETTQTNIVNNQENNEVNFSSSGADSIVEDVSRIESYTDDLTGEEHIIHYSSNAEEETEKANTLIEKGKKFGEDIYEGTAKLQDSQAVQAFLNLFSDADTWDATDVTGDAHVEDHGGNILLQSMLDKTNSLTGDHYMNYYIKVHGSIPSGGGGGFDGTAHVNGTAFYKGNAFKGGNWGVSKTQEALVGELGTEIMVTPNGQWQTIGEGGAEFTRIPKGSIIFNHKQSEELLKNGHVTSNRGRGTLVGFANGTAFSHGTNNGAIKPTVSSKGMGGSTTSKGNGGSNGGNGGNRGGNNNKSSEKAKETKNTLDEVEILIARIERQISRLDNTIGNTYIKWATRNQAVTRDLKKVSKEIVEQRKAYDTYMTKANSIGLPEEWAKKVREGKQAIEDVVEQAKESGDNADSLWDKITKYREYYEKALAALDKVQELEQKEGELYKTRFDHEQTYYEEMIDNLQHTVDIMGAYNDQLEESGKLNSRNLIIKQMSVERAKLQKLEDEYKILVTRQDEAVKSGKIKKYSEAWYEMQQAINEVRDAIVEANTNLISFDNAFREVNWNRWDKIHDAISGVTNELEFLYDLIDEDKMFDDTGTITNEGLAAFGLLAQEYDTYFAEVERYRDEIQTTKDELAEDPYNQNLVDKLKEQIEAQQDAVNGAKKTKEAMLDVAENGVKKQIDYIKKLIDDYEELMDAQKDQSDYAKKVADQQKEINKLEKQYRAIQNDTSEEGATKRQQLREQLKEKRQDLADTQEDRRISETKDMLAKFQETFEDFLENKLKDVEGIIKEGITGVNNNTEIIKDTIESVADSYGYTLSNTLQTTLSGLSNNLASYFDSAFDNRNVKSIADGVDAIVTYYNKAQVESNRIAMADKVKETGTHIQAYVDEKGKTHVGYFDKNGNQKTDYTGQARNGDKIYRFENGQKVTQGNRWVNEGGKKYYLNKDGTYATGVTSINGKKYYFDSTGQMKTAWQTINGKKYHFNKQGVMHTGLVTIGKNKYYFDKNGVLQMGKWQTIDGKRYYLSATDGHVLTGKQKINGEEYTFYNNGVLKGKGWKKGTSSVPKSGYAWTNENGKAEAIIRKSDGAILTPLGRGDAVIPNSAMKNVFSALTNPNKYFEDALGKSMKDLEESLKTAAKLREDIKQNITPKIIQAQMSKESSTPATINMQFIANGVQDANKFANDLMNNKKLENWIQEITLGRANGNNSFRKYSYAIR